ncbi:uncharacterized protein LOC126824889 [Patella vulgata]|uniref:uncharacterized protein LOC126824889 n=1 Tax=Patella vulgata TaxID=6465 RepID=UPI00217F7A16|nr:uncharacterized protein LOC126824889 [Patella vulgata]
MSIESSFTCRYDYLLIYNGNSTNSDVLGRFCGSSTTSVSSRDNSILITFVSDWGVQYTGFKLKYFSTEFVKTTSRPTTITMTTESSSSNGSGETDDSQKIVLIIGALFGSLFVLVVFFYSLGYALHTFKTKYSTNINPSNNSYNQSYHNNGHMNICAPPPYEEHALPDSPPPNYETIDPNRISNAAAVLRNMFNNTDRMGSRTRNHRRMSVECESINGHSLDESPRMNNNISSFTNNNSPPFISTAADRMNSRTRNHRRMSVECVSINGHTMDDSPGINNNISSITDYNSPSYILVAPISTAATLESNTPRRNMRPIES